MMGPPAAVAASRGTASEALVEARSAGARGDDRVLGACIRRRVPAGRARRRGGVARGALGEAPRRRGRASRRRGVSHAHDGREVARDARAVRGERAAKVLEVLERVLRHRRRGERPDERARARVRLRAGGGDRDDEIETPFSPDAAGGAADFT